MLIDYPSKCDLWLRIVLLASGSISFVAATMMILSGVPWTTPAAIATVLLGAGLPLWLLKSTYYQIDTETLWVHSGPSHWRIPIREIERVRASRNLLSSPALSLDRLEVRYSGNKWVLISPVRREEFLADLRLRGAQID